MANFPRTPSYFRDEQRQPAVTATRVVFALVGAAAMVLGFIGLDQYLASDDPASRHLLNLLYGTLQLFVLGSDPLDGGTNFPPALQIARFAAPAVTLYAVTEACRLLLATEVRRLRARRARGHVVVCGDSSVARTLASRLHLGGHRVVVVRSQPIGPLELRRRSLLGVNGEASDPDVLRGAGAGQATVIYACTDDSAANVAIATAAARLVAQAGGDTAIYAQIHDPERALALQARRLGVPRSAALRLDFFNIDQLAVHVLMDQQPLPVRADRPPRLLVAGDSPLARALLVGIARHWRLHRGTETSKVEVDFVAADATHVIDDLTRRYITLRQACRISPHEVELADLLSAADATAERYDRAFLCYADEEHGLQVALTAHRLWYRVAGAVIVPVDRLAGLADAFNSELAQPLLDQLDGRLQLFPMVSAGCDPTLIAEDLSERLARLLHERFVAACLARGERPETSPALVDWAALDEERRRSNRLQAADIGPKLHLVDCAIVPRSETHDDFSFTDEEIELLAQHEQRRWAADTASNGWRLGRQKDGNLRRTPYLVEWEHLPPDGRDKCRSAVRDIPEILGDAGFQVVRLTDTRVHRALRAV